MALGEILVSIWDNRLGLDRFRNLILRTGGNLAWGNPPVELTATPDELNALVAGVTSGAIPATRYMSNTAVNVTSGQISALAAHMDSIAGTVFGASNPPNTARKVMFPGGKYAASPFQTITTWGSGATIHGEGPVTQLDGIGLLVEDSGYDIQGLNFNTALIVPRPSGYIALNFRGPLRGGHLSNIRIQGYETGILRNDEFASFEEWSGVNINRCRDGMIILESSFQFDQFNVTDCDDYCLLVLKAGEIKATNSTFRGAGIANMALIGSRRSAVVECYWTQLTLTGADAITFPILAVNDVGGFGQLVIGTEHAVTAVEDRGSIMCQYWYVTDEGVKYYYVADLVRVLGATGQVDSIEVGGVELLSAPVPFTTSTRVTATAIAAAINAGTGSHGFTARDANGFFYIESDDLDLAGEAVVASCSGGDMTVTGQHFVAFVCATPHGLEVGDWSASDVPEYEGCEPVRHVEDDNTFLWLMPEYAGTGTGSAWKPHFYTSATNSMRIVSNTYNAPVPSITAVGKVTLTTTIPYADISGLGPEAVTSTPGNDLYIDCVDSGQSAVNDQNFGGGNINRAFIASGTNIVLKGTRTKNEIIVVPRAHRNLRPQGIMFETPARGRAEEVLSITPVTGAAIGWGRQGFNINDSINESYWFVQYPTRTLPIVNGIPQTVETRWYYDRVDTLIGDVVIESKLIDIVAAVGTNRQLEFIRQGNTIPQVFHSGGIGATSATMGTDRVVTTPYNRHVVEVYVPETTTITGISILNGSVVAGNVAATLCTMEGDAIVGAGTASVAVSGTNAFQKIPFAAPYTAVGPRRYLIYTQYDDATCRLRVHAVGNFLTVVRAGVAPLGTFASFTPPTTFVADVGPICDLY